MTLGGENEADNESEYLQAIYDILSSKIQGFDQLVTNGIVTSNSVNINVEFGLHT